MGGERGTHRKISYKQNSGLSTKRKKTWGNHAKNGLIQ